MAKVLIIYATSEGQTAKIAGVLAETIRAQGLRVDSQAVEDPAPDLAAYDAVMLGASVHVGQHSAAMQAFIRQHQTQLQQCIGAFFSVSLNAASPLEAKQQEARSCAQAFLHEAGWQPRYLLTFAGALRYSKYSFFKRLLMRLISSKQGNPSDSGRDYEYTDWQAVRDFAETFAAIVRNDTDPGIEKLEPTQASTDIMHSRKVSPAQHFAGLK